MVTKIVVVVVSFSMASGGFSTLVKGNLNQEDS